MDREYKDNQLQRATTRRRLKALRDPNKKENISRSAEHRNKDRSNVKIFIGGVEQK